VREFLAMLESGHTAARTVDLERALDASELSALRRAGVLRAEDREGFEEISRTDLARALRTLYHVQARGLPVPTAYGKDWATLGWSLEGGVERTVILCDQPSRSLRFALHHPHRARILVPCARSLSAAVRRQNGPGAIIEVEALEESLRVEGGRLARAGVHARDAHDVAAPPEGRGAAPLRIPGAPRWNVVVIARVDPNTVYVSVPGRSLRCTYSDLGMAHRSTRKPLRHWDMLLDLCDEGGVFLGRRYGKAGATKKVISRLSGALGEIFGLRESALHRYVRGEGWRTRFRALPYPPESK
jgi:hypothetical protein